MPATAGGRPHGETQSNAPDTTGTGIRAREPAPRPQAVKRPRRARFALWTALICALVPLGLVQIDTALADGSPGTAGFSQAVADDGARVIGEQPVDPRTLDVTIATPSLKEPAKVRLLLPPGWSRTASRTWPVLFLYHGFGPGEGHGAWTALTDVAKLTAKTDVIVAMPDAGPTALYTDYWNYGFGGPPQWERFHIGEIPQILERGYRANKLRAAGGLSSGALGSVGYATRHPGFFRAVASYSGTLCLQDVPVTPRIQQIVMSEGPEAAFGHPVYQAHIWHRHDPCQNAHKLRGTAVYLSAATGLPGELDFSPNSSLANMAEYGTINQAVKLASRIPRSPDTPVVTHFERTGIHAWPYWERELHLSFPMLMKALGVPM